MSCSNEAHLHDHHDHDHGHGHGQGHGGDGHDHHDHDHDVPLSSGPTDSLFTQIDKGNVVALNAVGGAESGQRIIKEWAEKDDESVWLESDMDDSLIVHIPFVSSVSIRSITLKAGLGGYAPSRMKLFVNRPGMDFSDVEDGSPAQELNVVAHSQGVEYQVKANKFTSVTHLTVYFPHNVSEGEDEETTRVFYLGLRGSFKPLPGRPGVIIYESAARPTDHKVDGAMEGATSRPGY